MTDKGKIKAEIERQIGLNKNIDPITTAQKLVVDSVNVVLTDLLDFIDSLQEEPVSNSLEEELDKYIKDNFTIEDEEVYKKYGVEPKDYMYSMDKGDMLKMLRHFQRREEPISEDLEEAASKYCEGSSFEDAVMEKPAFKAGAQWQKEWIIKKQ